MILITLHHTHSPVSIPPIDCQYQPLHSPGQQVNTSDIQTVQQLQTRICFQSIDSQGGGQAVVRQEVVWSVRGMIFIFPSRFGSEPVGGMVDRTPLSNTSCRIYEYREIMILIFTFRIGSDPLGGDAGSIHQAGDGGSIHQGGMVDRSTRGDGGPIHHGGWVIAPHYPTHRVVYRNNRKWWFSFSDLGQDSHFQNLVRSGRGGAGSIHQGGWWIDPPGGGMVDRTPLSNTSCRIYEYREIMILIFRFGSDPVGGW